MSTTTKIKNDNSDLLFTNDYDIHHKFFFSLVIGFAFTLFTFISLLWLNPIYAIIQSWIFDYRQIYGLFMLLTLTNNWYQVFAHVFTAIKFIGYHQIIPVGSADKQSLFSFTVSNVFDILGWLNIFVYYGYAHPFLVILAATHYGSGITAIFFHKTFQEYYIATPQTKGDHDSFKYFYWNSFRTVFVLIDAVTRALISYNMM